ncbi:MAG: two pore domain potassium channel family protein [Bacteroides sp.]|nr:two pore domain potassium channel family protein [Bacteroides sp.]
MNTKTFSSAPRQTKGIYSLLHLVVVLLSLFLVLCISIDTFNGTPYYRQSGYMHIQLGVCVVFLLDFFWEWKLAPRKRAYFYSHLIFLLVSIPYLNIVEWLHLPLTSETAYLLRFMPLVRGGYAIYILISWLTHNRASTLIVSYLSILLACIYFSSLVFFVAEFGINPLVHNYGDALWWAFMDATTVGSNIIAVTFSGRMLSILLAAIGMMMFPIFTVYITDVVTQTRPKP